MRHPATGLMVLATLFTGLAGCEREKAKPVTVIVTKAPLPALPDVAKPDIGKSLKDFGSSTDCRGAFDGVKLHHTGQVPGVEVEGWAWLTNEKRAPDVLLFTTEDGHVVGGATTNRDRPDVKAAVPEVTVLKVGWNGVVAATAGDITANALLPDHSLCKVGSFEISVPASE